MKKFCLLLLVAIPMLIFGQRSGYDPENRFTIAFYNIEDLFDVQDDPSTFDDAYTPSGEKHWTIERYRKKIKHIGKVLTSLNSREYPEIIGLAEVENMQVLEDLVSSENLRNTYYGIVHEDSPDMRGIDVAMLYRADEFEYLQHRSIPIVFPFDKKSKVRDMLYVKGVASEKDTLHIFICHWKSRAGGIEKTKRKRIYSARTLKKYTDSIMHHNPSARIVLIGDFNDEPGNKSLSKVLDANSPEDPVKRNELYNLMYGKDRKGLGTYNYKYEWYMLDNFIVSSALLRGKGYTIREENVRIFNPPWVLHENPKAGMKIPDRTYGGNNYFGGYSDHLAIYGIFRYEPQN